MYLWSRVYSGIKNTLIYDRLCRLVHPGSRYIPELSAAVICFLHKSLGIQCKDLGSAMGSSTMFDFKKELEEMARIAGLTVAVIEGVDAALMMCQALFGVICVCLFA